MNKKILIISSIALFLDQITKIIIDNTFLIDEVKVLIDGFLYLTRVFNTGAAFSILKNNNTLLIVISVILIYFIYKYMGQFKGSKLSNISFGLLYGGIFGNLIDRCFFGYVRDFIKVDIFNYNFPVFNIADSCIVVGVIFLFICIMKGEDNGSSSKRVRK